MKSKYYLKFTGKYLLRMVTLLFAVSVISFVLVSLSPSRSGTAVCGLCTKCECGAERKNSRILGLK